MHEKNTVFNKANKRKIYSQSWWQVVLWSARLLSNPDDANSKPGFVYFIHSLISCSNRTKINEKGRVTLFIEHCLIVEILFISSSLPFSAHFITVTALPMLILFIIFAYKEFLAIKLHFGAGQSR